MQLVIEFDGDKLINEVMESYPEASFCLQCISWKYKECRFVFQDQETGKEHLVTLDMLRKGLQLTLEAFSKGKFPGVAKHVMPNFQDAGNWDATAADILVQYSIFGEVMYG
jgi:hypothetical protein